MTEIKFPYNNITLCDLKNGCCCICKHQAEVFKHCGYHGKQEGCICNESLNFYICTLFKYVDNIPKVYVHNEHGVCEGFIKRK